MATAGQVGIDSDGAVVGDGFEAQARQAFENLGHCLAAAGCGFADVFKVNVYLPDLGDFEAFNRLYVEYFAEPYPARTTVQAGLALDLKFEIEALAVRPEGQAS